MPPGSRSLLRDVRELILGARSQVAQTVDASLTMLYWQVGSRIRSAILGEKRAKYGEKVVTAIAARLEVEFGRGFGEKNLRRMIQFAEKFPDEQIVAALLRQLGWTHFTLLLPIKDSLRREFYTEMCRVERWNTRTLQKKIQSMLFERTALSRRPQQLAQVELKALRERDQLTPDLVFRDPYFLDFLGLKDTYAERDLEMAILREMESFILELGAGFAFLERQKRMIVDGGKRQETIELVDLDSSGIKVPSYWTETLPKAALESKLHEATRLARQRLVKNGAQAGEKRGDVGGRAGETPS
jgi:predicted nuclease of restriction endonuclease-like (RecB) superfamily